jgi:hypothetical protein
MTFPKGRSILTSSDRLDEASFAENRREHGTPMVQLAHPRNGVWSGKNQLGVELPFSLDANRMQTIFKLDEWGFPEVWTISLGLALPTELTAGQVFDIVGEVSFGAGGVTQQFEVDWVEGTMFSLPMNAVNVRARWSDFATINGIQPPEGIRVSTVISKGSLRHARATLTNYMGGGGANGIPAGTFFVNTFTAPPTFLPIPAFAKSVVVLPRAPADAANLYIAASSLQFLTDNNTAAPAVILGVPGNFLGPTASFKVPIPATSRYFTFFNGGAAPASATFVWNLFDE